MVVLYQQDESDLYLMLWNINEKQLASVVAHSLRCMQLIQADLFRF